MSGTNEKPSRSLLITDNCQLELPLSDCARAQQLTLDRDALLQAEAGQRRVQCSYVDRSFSDAVLGQHLCGRGGHRLAQRVQNVLCGAGFELCQLPFGCRQLFG